MNIVIHTDGSCWPNPGPGAWAYHISIPLTESVEGSGKSEGISTNNRMEITAAIKALERLSEFPKMAVVLVTDSEYLRNGAKTWMKTWRRKDFRNVKNADLWRRIAELSEIHNIDWQWVRGHDTCALNNRVDQLAEAKRKE